MKAPAFDYLVPQDLKGALRALSEPGNSKVIAGGQSLGPMLNLRVVRPERLIDISRIQALQEVEDGSDHWRIGAGVTHARIEDAGKALVGLDVLPRIAQGIAYRAVRNRGTIGGSLVHADPAADWPLALATLGAAVEIQGRKTRRVKASMFMRAAFSCALAPDELVTAVTVPKLGRNARFGYFKFCRKTGEFPEASAAVLLDPDRKVARIFVGALAGPPKPVPGVAEQIARSGPEAVSNAHLVAAVDAVSRNAAMAVRQMHVAALKRAIGDAFRS